MLSDNLILDRHSIRSTVGLSGQESAANVVPAIDALNSVARPQSLADEAHGQLLMQLEMGLWPIASKLPSEMALAESLGVSRPVVREALARLKADGRIETRQGSGAVVADRNKIAAFRFAKSGGVGATEPMIDAADAAEREMLELRQIVECGAAELAALRRTHTDVAAIRAAVDAMDGALEKRSDGSDVDDAFHNAVAAATHNSQLTKFVEFVGAQFSASRKATWDKTGYGVGITEVGQDDHRAILKAIDSGDAATAKRMSHAHVQRAIDRINHRIDERAHQQDIERRERLMKQDTKA